MRRRELLKKGGVGLLAGALPQHAGAQNRAGNVGTVRPSISSSNLQWLRSADDVARAAIEMGFGGVVLTVGQAPAHVPVNDAGELKKYVARLRDAGLAVDTIQLTAASGGDALLDACEALGIRQVIFGPFPYTSGSPLAEQRSRYKPQLAALSKQGARFGVRNLYRNRAGLYLGASLLDLVGLLDSLDPKGIGICYDAGQGALSGGNGGWVVGVKEAVPQIGCVLCTDTTLHFQLDTDQGGVFAGTPNDLVLNATARKTPRPFGGGGGRSNPWIAPNVPLGTGLVDLPQLAALLKEGGFRGPLVVQSDYPNGGAENGGDNLSLPAAMVLGAMKRDLLTLRAGFSASGMI